MKPKDKEGTIYQINPEKDDRLGGQFVVATEIEHWGVQGYLLLDQLDTSALVRYKGRAFIRKNWDEIVKVGFAEWIAQYESKEEE